MTPPDQPPKLPLWVFLVTDAVLLFTAWFIANSSARPLSANVILAVAGCVVAGALLATVPIIAHYERVKNETLDDRQRSLETLSHTIAAAAEQISVAAHGQHEIAELAQRNLKAAEHLPQKLQEKIAAFKAQLDSAGDDGREELEKEIATLRAAEGERLESASDKMAKAVAELTRLEASAQKHLAASTAALEKATAALAATEAAAANHRSPISNLKSPEAPAGDSAEPVLKPAAQDVKPAAEPTASQQEADNRLLAAILSGQGFDVQNEVAVPATGETPTSTPPPKKRPPRKPKGQGATPPPFAPASDEPAMPAAESPAAEADAAAVSVATEVAERETSPAPETVEAKPEESAVSSDGATRLLVTAYIGIGNRLFIRGDGPGLSWDRGVPLQFVSIGKWRWETSDAASAVSFKLYKNDDTECSALGDRTLASGEQLEVTANF